MHTWRPQLNSTRFHHRVPTTVASPAYATRERTSIITRFVANQSLYEVLGVDQAATEQDIKRSYRRKALKLHPDVNKAADAQQQFMEAKMAFETLSDSRKRAEYDRRLRMGKGGASDWRSDGYGGSGSRTGGSRAQKPESSYSL
ncbi:J domain-containing protein, partial [Haematococcus lacustris]